MILTSIQTRHFINNEFVDSKSQQTFDTIDPSTGKTIVAVQRGNSEDIDLAVQAARKSFSTLRDVSGPTRRDLLLQLAYLLEENKQFVAEIESKDNGKTVSVARDVDIACEISSLFRRMG